MRTQSPASSVYSSLVTTAQETIQALSPGARVLFYFLASILVISAVSLLYILNTSLLYSVPAHGGSLSEGVIGAPRFINPVLAVSDADRDLTALVYSGLLKANPEGGYIPDLAESYTISPDGKTYTFTLRANARFEDGTPVTADDVLFTIQKTQDPTLNSPEEANWNGISVQKINDRTVSFTLGQAYAPFIENLTVGILPKHLWQNVSDDEFPYSDLNTEPVGSGPFKVESLSRTSSGVPSSYTLVGSSQYTLQHPYLSNITFHFYQNEDALIDGLNKGEVHAASGVSPSRLSEVSGRVTERAPLNRVFGVFFNQNQSAVLRDSAVRDALNNTVNRSELVQQVLGGYGTPLTGPLPPSAVPSNTITATSTLSTSDLVAQAKSALLADGWQPGPTGVLQKTTGSGKNVTTQTLSFSISTGNVPELRAAAEYLRKTWDSVGADVTVQIYDQGDLAQNVIRPRKYDALLFGEVIGREPDLFAFWSSSERLNPGLNIAMYTNASADKLLSQLRATTDEGQKNALYQQFTTIIAKDDPAVFLYAPDFVYIVPKDIAGLDLGFIETPSDRFLSVTNWHQETDKVWPLFAR